MTLPAVLRAAPVLWTPAAQLAAPSPSCGLSCYQPVTQCQTNWCWAAVMQELLRCIAKRSFQQCELVENYLAMPGKCCPCNSAVKNTCNRMGILVDYLQAPNSLLPCTPVLASNFTLGMLQTALCNGQPVVGLFYTAYGYDHHYAVISGITPGNSDYQLE